MINRSIGGRRRASEEDYRSVIQLPGSPTEGESYWLQTGPSAGQQFTHPIFRFPAKLHVPVVRWALAAYGRPSEGVFDPFTGSGTVQLESLLSGLPSVGYDVDPLACLITRVKCTPINPARLTAAAETLRLCLNRREFNNSNLETIPGGDISDRKYNHQSSQLQVPPIPNITHWLRRYVIIDLALLFRAIYDLQVSSPVRQFLLLTAASCIRRVSNADPTPVSGLEVTRVQAAKNPTRCISVWSEFWNKLAANIAAMGELWHAHRHVNEHNKARARVWNGSIQDRRNGCGRRFGLAITSPPYCQAVEYSRRHRLEHFWLNFVHSGADHATLSHQYIGRARVLSHEGTIQYTSSSRVLTGLLRRIEAKDHAAAAAVSRYFMDMQCAFVSLRAHLNDAAYCVCVVGDSTRCGIRVPTADILAELALESFSPVQRFKYAVRNHSMHYGLRNGHGIREEHVLVLKSK